MKLHGLKAIITGGANGIGLATAERLIKEGVSIVLWDIDAEALEKAKERLTQAAHDGARRRDRAEKKGKRARGAGELPLVTTAVGDVGDPAAVQGMAEKAEGELGRIDILINNAGHMAPGSLLDQPVEVWKKTVDINLNALIYTIHALLPGMYRRGTGHVVNISSAGGFLGVPGLSVYCATKWAVFGLTEALREEALQSSGGKVRFSSVHPMFLRTGMFEGASLSGLGSIVFPRVASHDVIAKAIVEGALKRGRRVVKRPRSLRLVLLLRGILPDRLFNVLSRLMNVHTSMSRLEGGKQ